MSVCRICGQEDGPDFYDNHKECDRIVQLASRPFLVPAGVSFEDAEQARIEWARKEIEGGKAP